MLKHELVKYLREKGLNPEWIVRVPYTDFIEVYDGETIIWEGQIIDYDEEGRPLYEEC